MRRKAVVLPDLGVFPRTVMTISHWFVEPGRIVWRGDRLVEVLVGAATFDVSAPHSGRLVKRFGRVDDPVAPGTILAYLDADDDPEDDPEPDADSGD